MTLCDNKTNAEYWNYINSVSEYPFSPILTNLSMWLTSNKESGTIWTDISGNINNGLLSATGIVRNPLHSSGALGDALSFDGTGMVTISNNASINLGTSNFSLEIWGNITASLNNGRYISNYYQGGASTDIGIRRGNISLFSRDASASINVDSGIPAVNTGWHHIVATRNLNIYSIYVDGILRNTATGTMIGALTLLSRPWTIGAESLGVVPITGIISEARIYNDYALTSTDVYYNYTHSPTYAMIKSIIN